MDGQKQWIQTFSNGIKTSELHEGPKTDKVGTMVGFYPNEDFMETTEMDIDTIRNQLEMKSYIVKGVKFIINDVDNELKKTFYHKEGIVDYVKDHSKNLLFDPITFEDTINYKKKVKKEGKVIEKNLKIGVEIVMGYNQKSTPLNLKSFCNALFLSDDGNHVIGFKTGLTRVIKKYITDNKLLTKKDEKLEITGDDVLDSLVAVISIKHPDPQFYTQNKSKLTNEELRGVVSGVITEKLTEWLNVNSNYAKMIANKAITSAKANLAAKRAREQTTKKGESQFSIVSDLSKFSPSIIKDPSQIELFICEGDSAAGTTKNGRDKKYQALYQLRGKILNTNNLDKHKMLSNKEISDLTYIITGKKNGIDENFDINDLKFDKILTACDSDIDGYHIQSLLLTFFYQHMRPLVEQGHFYFTQPPLYSITEKGKKRYFLDQEEYDDFIFEKIMKLFKFLRNGKEIKKESNIKTVLSKMNQYINKITEISNNQALDVGFIDEITESYIENPKGIIKFIKSNYDVTFGKDDETKYNFEGFYKDKFIVGNIKDIVKNIIKPIIEFKEQIKLTEGITIIYNSEETIFNAEMYQKIYKIASPSSRNRMKGLGEMNYDELWETTLNPENRNIIQVLVADVDKANENNENLFNGNTKYADERKLFILKGQHKIDYLELDI